MKFNTKLCLAVLQVILIADSSYGKHSSDSNINNKTIMDKRNFDLINNCASISLAHEQDICLDQTYISNQTYQKNKTVFKSKKKSQPPIVQRPIIPKPEPEPEPEPESQTESGMLSEGRKINECPPPPPCPPCPTCICPPCPECVCSPCVCPVNRPTKICIEETEYEEIETQN